jgi:hypothetical protein
MENKNKAIGGGRTIASRSKVASQNICFIDPIIREKAIGRLRVGPILADQRNALPHGAPDLRQQFAKPIAKPRIPKFASGDFSINPILAADTISTSG